MQPRVSVVIPVYNRAKTVLPTLESVRGQTFRDFECLVVDDGSKDGEELRQVVEGLKDKRFRYVRRENGGASAARNTGIDEAKGAIVAFLDSDDRWLPEKLEVQVRQLAEFPDRIAYCQCLVERGGSKRWVRPRRGIRDGENLGEYLFVQNQFIPTPTIALPAGLARRTRWDSQLAKGQDLDFVLRLNAAGNQFLFWPEPLVVWTDIAAPDRTSYATGTNASELFLRKNTALLTPKANRGFRVSYLAYDMAKENPSRALRDLIIGAVSGVPFRIVLRQSLRAFLPRRFYRQLVDSFVAVMGK